MIDPTTDSDRRRYWTHSEPISIHTATLEIHPAEVASVAEARAAAIVDMFPEQAPGTVAALAQAVNTLTAMVNELAVMVNRQSDELEYLRRKIG